MRKTTYCKKYAYDWATKKQAPQGCGSTAFKAVLLRKFEKCILMFGEPLMSNFCPETSMKKSNNNIILLILDGLDELPSSKLSIFLKIN